ncbi:hypothetical protein [Sagittula sp. SSi028]|uniref:hypothetical protein n=1 Tax=Sagittula sp. SSi028 TaxID=3400636 RepID=UPI003AF8BBFE
MSASKTSLRNGAGKGFEKAAAHARDAMDTARETLETGYDEAREHASQALDAAQEGGRQALDEGVVAVRDAHGKLEGMVRRNPTTALLGAAGLGLLFGLALKGRK